MRIRNLFKFVFFAMACVAVLTSPFSVSASPVTDDDKAPWLRAGKWIEIVLSEQQLNAWQDGSIVMSTPISSGTRRTPTPRGTFKIYTKYARTRMRGPGYDLPNVPYVMYFKGSYGLHGTYWHNNFGRPMSHGCVNLPTSTSGMVVSMGAKGNDGRCPLSDIKKVKPTRAQRRIALAVVLMAVTMGALCVFLRPVVLAEQHWQRIQMRGTLRIGIDSGVRPFSFFGPQGWKGYEADVAREVAHRLNLQVESILVGYDGFYDALLTNRVDVSLSVLVPDTARLNEFTYSDTTVDVGVRLIGKNDRTFTNADSLQNQRVAVVLGGEADRVARFYERRIAGMRRIEVADAMAALDGIRVGTFDWATINGLSTLGKICKPITQTNGKALQLQADIRCYTIQPQPYTFAISKNNGRLIDAVNAALREMQADETLDTLSTKWLERD